MDLQSIVRYLCGDMDEAEKKKVTDWISENEQNKGDFDKFSKIWEKSGKLNDFENISAGNDWELIKPDFKPRYTLRSKKIPLNTFLFRAAVLLIFAAGLAYGLYKIVTVFPKNNQVYVTSDESVKDLILPDGTLITLNKNSVISYNHRFNKTNREVFFNGEAYFDVNKGNSLPFVIRTKSSTIQVLGTSFNIKDDSTSVKVTVISGKVWLYETANRNNYVKLTTNETASFKYTTKQIIYGQNNDLNFLSWKTGRFEFFKTPTVEALNTIAEHFNKKLIVRIPLRDSLTGVFENQPLDEILKEIELASSLTIENQLDYIIVRK